MNRESYLENKVRVEPDLLDGRNEGIEEGGAEIDDSVGGDEGGGHRRFAVRPVILAEGVESEEREHSTRNPLPDSHFHFRKLEFQFSTNREKQKIEFKPNNCQGKQNIKALENKKRIY